MLLRIRVLVVVLCFWTVVGAEIQEIYLSNNGSSTIQCGSIDNPCLTLQSVIGTIHENTTNIVIYVFPGMYMGDANCEVSFPSVIVSIQSVGGLVSFQGEDQTSSGLVFIESVDIRY